MFDEGKRLWLIDWETAYRNDRLVDVAILTLYLAASPELEGMLLKSWLGRAPDRALRARLILMRQLVRLFYGCAASLHAAAPGVVPDTDLAALTPAEFRAAVEEGRLVLGAPETSASAVRWRSPPSSPSSPRRSSRKPLLSPDRADGSRRS